MACNAQPWLLLLHCGKITALLNQSLLPSAIYQLAVDNWRECCSLVAYTHIRNAAIPFQSHGRTAGPGRAPRIPVRAAQAGRRLRPSVRRGYVHYPNPQFDISPHLYCSSHETARVTGPVGESRVGITSGTNGGRFPSSKPRAGSRARDECASEVLVQPLLQMACWCSAGRAAAYRKLMSGVVGSHASARTSSLIFPGRVGATDVKKKLREFSRDGASVTRIRATGQSRRGRPRSCRLGHYANDPITRGAKLPPQRLGPAAQYKFWQLATNLLRQHCCKKNKPSQPPSAFARPCGSDRRASAHWLGHSGWGRRPAGPRRPNILITWRPTDGASPPIARDTVLRATATGGAGTRVA